MKLLTIILLTIISVNAQANLSAGVSTMSFNDDLHYQGKKFRPTLNIGWVESFDRYVIGIYTTRFNHSQKRSLKNGSNIKTKVQSDILKIGKRYNKLIYSGFVANTMIKATVLNQVKRERFISTGGTIDFLLTKNISIGIFCLLPNKIGNGCGLNSSYNF